MNRSLEPSFVKGEIKAPPSKSMTQRAIAAALLANGTTVVTNPSDCDDSLAAISIAISLGAEIIHQDKSLHITGSGKLRSTILNCRESGLAIRMFSPIASLYEEEIIISGTGSLRKRPMSMITDALDQLGVNCKSTDGYLPLTIRGPMKGGNIEIDGSVSSQLLTGLLMALPLAGKDSAIKVHNLKSKPYIDMTIGILGKFGIRLYNENYDNFLVPGNQKYLPVNYEVEGDWSGGAFLLVAAAINGNLSIYGLDPLSSQSDKSILIALEMAGAKMIIGPEKIDISKSALESFEFDATESPDLFPPLVALASYCNGTSIIKGVSRLGYKESDRASALQQEFGKMSIKTEIKNDLMYVTGGKVKGACINSHGDHRIAMAAAVAALGSSGKVIIAGAEAVAKSYPGFFDDLANVNAAVKD
jgi:3-phosphoshikimate 1-carboxyvinyltransferase